MELFNEWKKSMIARKRISTKNVYYGYIGIVQSNDSGDNYLIFEERYVIARECKRGDKTFYKDVVMKDKEYGFDEDLSLPVGSFIFHKEGSLEEFLLPNEMYLNEVAYGRLLDLYYQLNDGNVSYGRNGKMTKVLEFKRKS